MGYVLTSSASPDGALIDACARYIGCEDNDGVLDDISGMAATAPEGWRALAAAADHAAETKNDGHAATLIFVMQRSLLGKRQTIRNQPRLLEPANVNPPRAARIPPMSRDVSAMNEASAADILASWCTGSRATAETALAADAPGLSAKIRARQAMAPGLIEAWKPASVYLDTMGSLTLPDAGGFFTTA